MDGTPILLYRDTLSTTSNTVIYTAPSDKVIVLKSILICNFQDTPLKFNMQIEGTPFVGSRTLGAYETLVIPIADLVLRPSAQLRAWCNTGTCSVRITGNALVGTMAQNGLLRFGTSVGTSGSPRDIITPTGSLQVIKSVVFCNSSSQDVTINMRIGPSTADNYTLIKSYKLAATDTIHIPFVDTLLLGSDTVTAWIAESTGLVYCHIVTKAVT